MGRKAIAAREVGIEMRGWKGGDSSEGGWDRDERMEGR